MYKESYYFSHDYEPIIDPKISAMLDDFGASGYGYFWRITEMLHSQSENKLELRPLIYKAIAKQIMANATEIEKYIKCCIEDYELFLTDGKFFWSERVKRNISKREEISIKRSEAGKRGAFAKQVQANAKQNQAKKGNKENINTVGAPNGHPGGGFNPNITN